VLSFVPCMGVWGRDIGVMFCVICGHSWFLHVGSSVVAFGGVLVRLLV